MRPKLRRMKVVCGGLYCGKPGSRTGRSCEISWGVESNRTGEPLRPGEVVLDMAAVWHRLLFLAARRVGRKAG